MKPTAGSSLQPAVPLIPGLTPLLSNVNDSRAFALYQIVAPDLLLLEITGLDTATSGDYELQIFVAGDSNRNGVVDASDSQIIAQALGTEVGDVDIDPDRDGVITHRTSFW